MDANRSLKKERQLWWEELEWQAIPDKELILEHWSDFQQSAA
jgi:hypothetical protein